MLYFFIVSRDELPLALLQANEELLSDEADPSGDDEVEDNMDTQSEYDYPLPSTGQFLVSLSSSLSFSFSLLQLPLRAWMLQTLFLMTERLPPLSLQRMLSLEHLLHSL